MSKATTTAPEKKQSSRLLSLDILRGITIAGMIMVNNPGSWGHIYTPLGHAAWNGLTPTDLVFPFFMFIMGISTYFSLRRYDFTFSKQAFVKIAVRTVVIFLIGIFIAWFSKLMYGMSGGKSFLEAAMSFDQLRILGVMPRLALCYGVGSICALLIKHRLMPWFIALILVVYTIILLVGNGYEFSDRNIISIVDHKVLGPDHMYADTIDGVRLKFDPEGLLSTLPAIAHMLIGFVCGGLIISTKDNRERINRLFIVGVILTFAGFLLAYGLPINKKIWSPTFVLTTCGLASSFLGLLIWIIDIKGHKRWCRFFEVFGINPLFLYCLGAVLSIIFGDTKIPWDGAMMSIKSWGYKIVCMPVAGDDATFASLIFALSFVILNWLVGLILYKKKIYIKI